jgi:hypothetical protein
MPEIAASSHRLLNQDAQEGCNNRNSRANNLVEGQGYEDQAGIVCNNVCHLQGGNTQPTVSADWSKRITATITAFMDFTVITEGCAGGAHLEYTHAGDAFPMAG